MISATASITAKVSRYCTSVTANEKRGGTKKKSKRATLTNAASTAGPRPNLTRHQHDREQEQHHDVGEVEVGQQTASRPASSQAQAASAHA